jgi:hypothetical protein
MRVSSLSDARVRRLVSTYFVPVWVSRDHYQQEPPSRAEQDELRRIDLERGKRKLPGGTVCCFVLDADGTVLSTLPLIKALKPANLVEFLDKFVKDKKLKPRSAEERKASATPPPPPDRPASPKGLLLHVWVRFVRGPDHGASRDRIDLSPEQAAAFLPSGKAKVGKTWVVPAKTADRLLELFYPPASDWRVQQSKVERERLTARVVAVGRKEVTVSLSGEWDLRYPYRGKPSPTDGRVKGKLVGQLRYRLADRVITSFELASDGGNYVWFWKGKPLPPTRVDVAVEAQR